MYSKKLDSERPLGWTTLGVDAKLDEWIRNQRISPVMVNSSVKSRPKLELTKLKLLEMEAEIGEKLLGILENLPPGLLSKYPGFDPKIYDSLKSLRQNVRARIRQTDRKLMDSEVVVVDDLDLSSASYEDNENKENYSPKIKLTTNTQMKKSSNYKLKKPHTQTTNSSSSYESKSTQINQENIEPIEGKFLKNDEINYDEEIITMDQARLTSWYNDSEDENYDDEAPKGRVIDYDIKSMEESRMSNLNYEFEKIDCELDFVKSNELWRPNSKNDESKYIKPESAKSNEGAIESGSKKEATVSFIGNVKNDGAGNIFNRTSFVHSYQLFSLFKSKFGLHEFRPNQLAAINAAILGHDCFILMPTGGGKSLCYQLPALLSHGVTVVISPLRSLIVDQKQKLDSLDISAVYMTGDLTQSESNSVYRMLNDVTTDLKLLYVTPEKLCLSPKFLKAIEVLYARCKLARFVIDEVHCVSQWGHDFRPDYNKLSMLKEKFPDVPLMVLTATATERVRSDILHQLHLDKSCKWFISSFNRPNLRYSVVPKRTKSSNKQVAEIIKSKFKNECGIVYCLSRRDCDACAQTLKDEGINALSYHAGLDDKLRIERQTQWISERLKVICATVAFGMGIDKPNVRFVIHAAMPKSMEGYYQESGRAGRDGESADCVLLYNYGDVYKYRKIIENSENSNAEAIKTHLDNLGKIVHYCDNLYDCRRALQLNYFGEKFDRQVCIAQSDTTCDNCKTYDRFVDVDVTNDAKALVDLICTLSKVKVNNVTILQVVDLYKGSDISSIRYKLGQNYTKWHGKGKEMTKHEIERLIHKLIVDGYLSENIQLNNGIMCAYVVPGPLYREILFENSVEILMQKKKTPKKPKPVAQVAPQMSAVALAELKAIEQSCYTKLCDLVGGIAGALDVSANSIMNMVAIRTMSQKLPCNESEMMKIPHVTRANFEKYGKALLDITKKFAAERRSINKFSKILEEEDEQMRIGDKMIFEEHGDLEKNPSVGNKRGAKISTPGPQSKKFKNNKTVSPSEQITSWINVEGNGSSSSKPVNKSKVGKTPSMSAGKQKKLQFKNTSSSNTSDYNGPGLCELSKK